MKWVIKRKDLFLNVFILKGYYNHHLLSFSQAKPSEKFKYCRNIFRDFSFKIFLERNKKDMLSTKKQQCRFRTHIDKAYCFHKTMPLSMRL